MSEDINLSLIDTEAGTQSREKPLDYGTVDKYAERMIDGDEFPPVDLFFDGKKYYPADGHQRIAARNKAYGRTNYTEFKTIAANVKRGTKRDAVLASISANTDHGLSRTGADIRHSVETLLRDEEWAKLSDREIARRVKMSHSYVNQIRKELMPTVPHLQSTTRIGGDGREIETANIGASKHWAFMGGHHFWELVDRLHLERVTILEKLQPGAVSLTDLTLSEKEALDKLNELADAKLKAQYPKDQLYYHAAKDRIYRISGYQAPTLFLCDNHLDNTGQIEWAVPEGVMIATLEQIDAYMNPPYPIETMVILSPGLRVGKVIDVKVTQVLISRKNPNDGGNNSHWAKLEDVSRYDEPPALPESEQVELAAGDTVKTRTGHIGKLVEHQGGLWVETSYGLMHHHLNTLTKIDPLPEADDQAANDELRIDEQLAAQANTDDETEFIYGDGTPLTAEDVEQRERDVAAALGITDDLTRPIHLNDPDLQEIVERFNDRFLRGSIDDAEEMLGDIQDVMGYLRVCQDTLNNELGAPSA